MLKDLRILKFEKDEDFLPVAKLLGVVRCTPGQLFPIGRTITVLG